MKMRNLGDWVLMALILVGLVSAARVSLQNLTGTACPQVIGIPICYVVLAAYALMFFAVIVKNNACKHYFFCTGWGVSFVIALLGTLAEVFTGGGVCPTTGGNAGIRGMSSGGIPMCFISLAMLVVILILFLAGPYRRACKACQI